MQKLSTGIIAGGLIAFLMLVNVGCDNAGGRGSQATEQGDEFEWMTDYEAAMERAEAEEKPVLAYFTGSDWCPPCMRLKEEVLSQPEFIQFAEEKLISMEVDFPRGKEQPEELRQQNRELAERYGIQGFPTIVLLNHDGTLIGQTGYRPGGAESYVDHLRELLEEAGCACCS